MFVRDSFFSSPISDNTNYSHNLQREEGKQSKIFIYKQPIFCIVVPLTNIWLLYKILQDSLQTYLAKQLLIFKATVLILFMINIPWFCFIHRISVILS